MMLKPLSVSWFLSATYALTAAAFVAVATNLWFGGAVYMGLMAIVTAVYNHE